MPEMTLEKVPTATLSNVVEEQDTQWSDREKD